MPHGFNERTRTAREDKGVRPLYVGWVAKLTDSWKLGPHELPNRVLLAPLAGIGTWFVRLQARRQELEQRAREIEIRESLLKSAEKRIEGRVEEMKATEAKISTATGQKAEQDAARFKGIITMYEGMKPKDAAKVFDRLEMAVLYDIASQIAPRKMSDIMGLMQPEAAERLHLLDFRHFGHRRLLLKLAPKRRQLGLALRDPPPDVAKRLAWRFPGDHVSVGNAQLRSKTGTRNMDVRRVLVMKEHQDSDFADAPDLRHACLRPTDRAFSALSQVNSLTPRSTSAKC